MIELNELREQWEGKTVGVLFGNSVIVEKEEKINGQVVGLLTVIRDDLDHEFYRCFRYFKITGVSWQVSVDGDRVSAETVMKWLAEPSAKTIASAFRSACRI